MFFHICSWSWKAFTKPILCGGARYQVMQQGRKETWGCPSPAAGQGSLLGSQPAAPLAPQPCLLCSHHQERLFSGGSFWPPKQGKQSKLSCPFLAFFCEPSVTSKPISRFFFGFTV